MERVSSQKGGYRMKVNNYKAQKDAFVRMQEKPIKDLNEDYLRFGLVIEKVSNFGLFKRRLQKKEEIE